MSEEDVESRPKHSSATVLAIGRRVLFGTDGLAADAEANANA